MPNTQPVAKQPLSRRVVLLNDTSSIYHFGCTATSSAMIATIGSLGHSLTTVPHGALNPASAPTKFSDFDSAPFFQTFWAANSAVLDRINAADTLLINGEGTLHGLLPIPLTLLYTAYVAKTRLQKNVQILNHSCYPQDNTALDDPAAYALYLKIYRALDFIALRESVSHGLLTTLGVHARRSFDCLPLFVESQQSELGAPGPQQDGPPTVLFAASALAHHSTAAAMTALARHLRSRGMEPRVIFGAVSHPSEQERVLFTQIQEGAPGVCSMLRVSTASEWLSAIGSARLLVSGRFHHSIGAASLGTPFVLLPSNTPKIDSLTELGAEPPLNLDAPGAERLLIERCEAALDHEPTARIGAAKLRARLCRLAMRNFEGLGAPVDRESEPHQPVPAPSAASAAAFLGRIAAFEREAAAHDAPINPGSAAGTSAAPAPKPLAQGATDLADRILRVSGVGRVIITGPGAEELRSVLLRRAVDAHVVESPSEGSGLSDQRPDQAVVALHLLEGLPEPDFSRAIDGLRRLGARDLFATVTLAPDRDRAWWEDRFFAAGYRKHPLTQHLFPFELLEHEEGEITLILQRIPGDALRAYPLESLKTERTLHMDMLRESGRRSDAHIARYTLACRFLRPGDRVLDCACGLGYGAAVLAAGSSAAGVTGIDNSKFAIEYAGANFEGPYTEFRLGDAADLSAIPDSSIDAVVSMETLEHLADPRAFLAECRRILTPAGRIILSVPNDWTDETGKDPNPHHLHVYTWQRLREQLEREFLIETAFAQIAGGGMKLADRARRLTRLDPASTSAATTEAEWYLAVAMKSPFPSGAPGEESLDPPAYRETVFPRAAALPPCNLVAYARDYDNPWLVRAMVSIGLRATEPALLRLLANQTIDRARPGSADQGAAICVLAYQVLADTLLDTGAVQTLLERIRTFDAIADPTPHAQRWRISNRYVAGLLLMALGRRAEAREAFLHCASLDPACFSPLLATKTVDALFQAGRLGAGDGDTAAARNAWRRGIDEARRALSGDWINILGDPDHPVSFGLPEAAQVLDLAARCAAGLVQLDEGAARPGQAWSVIHNASASEQLRWVRALESSNAWLDQQRRTWVARARELEDAASSHSRGADQLRSWVNDLEQGKAWLAEQIENYRLLTQQQEHAIEELKAEIADQKSGRDWLEQHAANWEAQARKQDGMIADLKKTIEDDRVVKEWLESSRAAWEQTANDRERIIEQLRAWVHQLEGAKR